jgi:uncharacterized protein
MAGCLCDECAALCCRYFALPIENPRTLRQYDDIRWYLCHENVVIFIEEKQWYLGIMARCKHLQDDNRCGIYETRPRICRNYDTDNCDYHGGEYNFEKLFTSADQLWEYAKQKVKEQRRKKRAKPAPAGAGRKPAKPARPSRRRVVTLTPVALAGLKQGGNGNGHPTRNGKSLSLPLLRS